MISLVLLGISGCALGMLLIMTSLHPQRNVLTRVLFRINTFMPRAGSMSDEKWVLLNGVGTLLAALFWLLCLMRFR
jgi:hypothetical protein